MSASLRQQSWSETVRCAGTRSEMQVPGKPECQVLRGPGFRPPTFHQRMAPHRQNRAIDIFHFPGFGRRAQPPSAALELGSAKTVALATVLSCYARNRMSRSGQSPAELLAERIQITSVDARRYRPAQQDHGGQVWRLV